MANSHRSNPPKSQTSFADEIDDAVLQELYAWVDQIPLSRPKKNLTRDFSDGGLLCYVIRTNTLLFTLVLLWCIHPNIDVAHLKYYVN